MSRRAAYLPPVQRGTNRPKSPRPTTAEGFPIRARRGSKPHGYTGVPGTCLWCGAPLQEVHHYESIPDAEARGLTGWKAYHYVPTGSYGYRGHNAFCTAGCGYSFGLKMAADGKRVVRRGTSL